MEGQIGLEHPRHQWLARTLLLAVCFAAAGHEAEELERMVCPFAADRMVVVSA
jgi:hypothetical protein